eukprot:11827670-Karenia_brevis.AAC.1
MTNIPPLRSECKLAWQGRMSKNDPSCLCARSVYMVSRQLCFQLWDCDHTGNKPRIDSIQTI